MSKLKKVAEHSINLPSIFVRNDDKIDLNDKTTEFLKENLFITKRNLAHDQSAGISIVHFVLDRAELEGFLGASIDDATCEIILDKFKEVNDGNIREILVSILSTDTIFEINYKYGDGVFHAIIIYQNKDNQ